MLTAALLAAVAFVAGVTGAWSPCGFSMVDTLAGAAGREGAAARRLVRAASATFAAGAVVGGAATFTALSALGALLGAGGTVALVAAAAIALAAAAADALGVRVAPQIRRQVPEPWRRTLPLPLAAALYGALLGLGFTTFVLAFAVWALAGIAVALGAPGTGLAIGVAFGLGRALPVVALAPRHDTLGARLATRMAEEPHLLRRLRRIDAALLAAAAVALALGPAAASADAAAGLRQVAAPATNPSTDGGALAWQAGETAVVRAPDGRRTELSGRPVAIGGGNLALRTGDRVEVTVRADGAPVATVRAARADGLAVARRWLAWRALRPGRAGDELVVAALPAPGTGAPAGPRRQVARVRGAVLSRPALHGDRLAYAVTGPRASRIVVRDLAAGRTVATVRSRGTQLSHPALHGDRLLYVEATACDQRLRLVRVAAAARGGRGRTLVRIGGFAWRDGGREPGRTRQGSRPTSCPRGTPPRSPQLLWATALDAGAAYVTLLWPSARTGAVRTAVARVAPGPRRAR